MAAHSPTSASGCPPRLFTPFSQAPRDAQTARFKASNPNNPQNPARQSTSARNTKVFRASLSNGPCRPGATGGDERYTFGYNTTVNASPKEIAQMPFKFTLFTNVCVCDVQSALCAADMHRAGASVDTCAHMHVHSLFALETPRSAQAFCHTSNRIHAVTVTQCIGAVQ